ncbi:MAG: pyridoxine 5'-phosphate synthase [Pseudomonadota bacterium]
MEQNNSEVRLGVNIDHIATIREQRGAEYPDLMQAIPVAEHAGADGITMHLREDSRHIQLHDVENAKKVITTTLNLEMAFTDEMVQTALRIRPDFCCIVPERREELTTEGGLDVLRYKDHIQDICNDLSGAGIQVSLFIEPDTNIIDLSKEIGAQIIEIHTGKYANSSPHDMKEHLDKIQEAAQHANNIGLVVNAGHGLDYDNVKAVAQIKNMNELNIGHSIISKSIFLGLTEAVRQMKVAMQG